MKIEQTQYGIRLVAQTTFEEQCLAHIVGKQLTAAFTDAWNRQGPVEVTFKPDEWEAPDGK